MLILKAQILSIILLLAIISKRESYLLNINHNFLSHHTHKYKIKSILSAQQQANEVKETKQIRGDATLYTEQTLKELYGNKTILPNWLLDKCEECGYVYPTMLQKIAFDYFLKEEKVNDVVLQAQTGSGKTLVYLLPLLSKINKNRKCIQGIIIVPTRELGLQVSRIAKRLASASISNERKIMIMNVLQGSTNKRQRSWAWADPPHIVISTPNELLKMLMNGGIKYNSVDMVIVDEIDACLRYHNNELHNILSRYLSPTFLLEENEDDESIITSSANDEKRQVLYQRKRETIFVSATIPQHHHFLKQCVQNQWTIDIPYHIHVSPGILLPPLLKHLYVVCRSNEYKFLALRRLINKIISEDKNGDIRILLFFQDNNRDIEFIAHKLSDYFNNKDEDQMDTYSSIVINESNYPKLQSIEQDKKDQSTVIFSILQYEQSLSQRATAIDAFRGIAPPPGGIQQTSTTNTKEMNNKTIRILLSTDLASRGLDIHPISYVINFDLPTDGDIYVHRAGRSGRLGTSGNVVSIITYDQEFVLKRLGNTLGLFMDEEKGLKCIFRQKR